MKTILLSIIYFNLKERNDFYRKALHYIVTEFTSHTFSKIDCSIFFIFWENCNKNSSVLHVTRNISASNSNHRSARTFTLKKILRNAKHLLFYL